jgi:hypothetical protein
VNFPIGFFSALDLTLSLQYFLNVYQCDLVVRDRLCIGDEVQVRFGPMEGRRGTMEKIHLADQSAVVK